MLIGERAWWGRGVVLDTRDRLLDFLLGPVGMEKVRGECYGNNASALFNYREQGWRQEGILRSHAVSDGRRVDVVRFAMIRGDRAS